MNLEESLRECTLALLRRIAAAHSVAAGEDTIRSELATLITDRFADQTYLQSFSSALQGEEKEVLVYLASHDWAGKAFLLERQFPRRGADPAQASPCLSLLQKGLLFRSFGMIDSWRGEIYHVPEEIRPALANLDGAQPSLPTLEIAAKDEPAQIDDRDGAHDLFCLLSFLHRAERRFHQGFLSRTDLPKLDQETGLKSLVRDSDEPEKRWRFLLRLGLGAGWIWRDGPFFRPGRTAAQVLSGSHGSVSRRMLERYLKDRNWSDLEAVGKVRQPLGSGRIDETGARQVVLHYLQEWAPGGWVSEDAFRQALRSANPDFLRQDYASLASAVVHAASETEIHGPDSWDLVEGEWLRYVLRGPLYWLGVVSWGIDSTGRRSAFRLRSGAQEEPSAPPSASTPGITFKEDFTVFAPRGSDLGLLYRLEPYMVFRATEGGGRAYRFTSASVHRGLEAGGSWADLKELVERSSLGSVPERVIEELEAWVHGFGRLILEGAILLTAATADELEAAARLPGVSDSLTGRLGPNSYRVANQRFWQLLSALREAGSPPKIDPTVGTMRARHATGDASLLRECLFAILVLRSLHGPVELDDGGDAQRSLEAALGPETTEEISRRAQDAVRKLRSRSETGW